jgi:folate-dependent phosphoribosylglycinamide formyltransferase PurN
MRVVMLVGDHLRHTYLLSRVAAGADVVGVVREAREGAVPGPPAELPADLTQLWRRHFDGRLVAEERWLAADAPDLPILAVTSDELNGATVHAFLRDRAADVVLSYGINLLSDQTLAVAGTRAWNIHGGLSPWYKGATTHFWPSYMLEPQMTGVTVHELTMNIDGGPIVHQSLAPLVRGDGIHDIACRAIVAIGDDLPRILAGMDAGQQVVPTAQRTHGRLWRSSDWRPEHLRLIYETYDDRIVDAELDGAFTGRQPKPIVALPAPGDV